MKNKSRFIGCTCGVIIAFVMMLSSAMLLFSWSPLPTRGGDVDASTNGPIVNFTGNDGDGSGTEQSPFLVGSRHTFNTLVRWNMTIPGLHFVMINDIDFENMPWLQLPALPLGSVFCGNGFTISNLNLSGPGLFNGMFGTIRNLTFENVNSPSITTGNRGAVSGTAGAGAHFENIRVESGNLYGSIVGGLFGDSWVPVGGTVTLINVFNGATINGHANAGGIIGRVSGADRSIVMENAINVGNVNGISGIGGIIGFITATGALNQVDLTNLINHGDVTATSANAGGVIGSLAGTNTIANMERFKNTGTITGGDNSAGIIGNIGAGINVGTLTYAMNTGTLNFNMPLTAGIVGTVSASNFTLDWALNTGVLTNSGRAGIIGNIVGGNTTIRNSIQDATLPSTAFAAITTRNNPSNLTIENSFFNNTLFAGAVNNNAAGPGTVTITGSEGRSTAQLRNAAFIQTVNTTGGENTFVLAGGQISLRVFEPVFVYTFQAGDGIGAPIVVEHSVDDLTITLPDANHPNLPTRIGFNLVGWTLVGQSGQADWALGATFTNAFDSDLIFNARWEKVTYTVVLSGPASQTQAFYRDGTPLLGTSRTIQIGEPNVTISNSSWGSDFIWLVRIAGTEGYTILESAGQTFSLSDRLVYGNVGESFINNHVENGQIFIRAVSGSETSIIHVEGPHVIHGRQPGTFSMQLAGEQPRQINLGSSLSLSNDGEIVRLTATPATHFTFVNFEVVDAGNNVVETITQANAVVSLNLNTMQGWTIRVNFARIEYSFEIFAAIRGQEETPITTGNLVAIDSGNTTDIIIGESATANATALSTAEGLRFARWRILNQNGTFTNVPGHAMGENELNLSFPEIDYALLAQFLVGGKITIIAEYVEVFNVSIVTSNDIATGIERGFLIIQITDGLTGESWIEDSISGLSLPYGSTIVIQAIANEFFELGIINGLLSGETVSNMGMVEFSVT